MSQNTCLGCGATIPEGRQICPECEAKTKAPSKPFCGKLHPLNTQNVIIAVDMQNDFITGVLGSEESIKVVPLVCKALNHYKARDYRVIYTQDTHYGDYLYTHEGKRLPIPHTVLNSYGWHVKEDIDDPDAPHIMKSAFGYVDWRRILGDNVKTIILVGLYLDKCVGANAVILRSMYPNADIAVIRSCVAATSPDAFDASIKFLTEQHIDILDDIPGELN